MAGGSAVMISGGPNAANLPVEEERDIAIIQKELPLDILEFFCLTPLPGSEDHQILWKSGVAMDSDLNKYDLEHVCTAHPTMSRQEWQAVYRGAWSLYYTPTHMKTLLRRPTATGRRARRCKYAEADINFEARKPLLD